MDGRGQKAPLEVRELLKTIAIVVLLLVGFHLLLYGYLKRRIDTAKRKQAPPD